MQLTDERERERDKKKTKISFEVLSNAVVSFYISPSYFSDPSSSRLRSETQTKRRYMLARN